MVIEQLIQSRLFHLISMLICIGVIAWLFVRHYFRCDSREDKDRINLLNSLYISGILAFIVIELITAICMGNTKHAEILSFVSFAATLSSLILSVVAIIFTIVSGNRGESQYVKLSKVSDSVMSSLKNFTTKTESIDKSIEKFQFIAGGLMEQIHEIYEKLSGLEKPINEMKERMLPIETVTREVKKTKEVGDDNTAHPFSRFIMHGSFSGNLALLACALSKEKNHPFKLSDIGENDDDQVYSFGYIVAASALGVVSVKFGDERMVVVKDCENGLKEKVERALNDYIAHKADADSKPALSDRLNKIKKIFD